MEKKPNKKTKNLAISFLFQQVRITVGMYSVYLQEWLKVFDRNQILIFRNEDYAHDMQNHLLHAFMFLDIGKYNFTNQRQCSMPPTEL